MAAGRAAYGDVVVMAAGQEAQWCISVGYGDIACSAVWEGEDGGAESEVWTAMVATSDGTATGSYAARGAGRLKLHFDNHSSWVYSKSVYWRLSLS